MDRAARGKSFWGSTGNAVPLQFNLVIITYCSISARKTDFPQGRVAKEKRLFSIGIPNVGNFVRSNHLARSTQAVALLTASKG